MNAMNIELRDNMSMSIDELVSGDVEITVQKRTKSVFSPWFFKDTHAKATIPSNRLDVIINFLERVKSR